MIRRYSELIQYTSFEDRFRYLKLSGVVANETFGFDRYLNQKFYKSPEWRHVRDIVIVRDFGCDLACKDREIQGRIIIHHMNPMTIEDLETNPNMLLDPEFLICVSEETHNAIHYGDESLVKNRELTVRQKNDTSPWKK